MILPILSCFRKLQTGGVITFLKFILENFGEISVVILLKFILDIVRVQILPS